MKRWKILSSDILCRTRVFNVIKSKIQLPNEATTTEFFSLNAPDWVNIIALTEDQNVILVRQYRHGIHDISLEIPGGVVESSSSTPLDAAQLELEEETGYTARKWTSLGSVSTNPALFSNRCHLFLAEGCVHNKSTKFDNFERIETELRSIPDFLKAIETGEIHHALVVSAVSRFLLFKGGREYQLRSPY